MVLDLSGKTFNMTTVKQEPQEDTEDVLDLCVKKSSLQSNNVDSFTNTNEESLGPVENNNNLSPQFSFKPTRPFKAFPKTPIPSTIYDNTSTNAYEEFRVMMLSQVRMNHNMTNKNMRRSPKNDSHDNDDPTYWEKRRKNNEAAKRSRDARRAKEDEIAIRCAFLQQENLNLRVKLKSLESETQRLHHLLYNS